ncbi:72 kDa inositol polyphosphate 5-phosphatase [Toxocara canis]|uniref:72 kDa inositol polyphosphate 5-phosphatase n=1 Tax=Toxocara canis TaxID=6265 RepID=A0A0B2VML2_TOXCA|nr:72 kDa inositol polyphosphate 5-phosphatase [Toxocara canis]
MPTRTRSLASRVVASLSSIEHPQSPERMARVDEQVQSEFHSMKRLESIAAHLRKYSIANEGFDDDEAGTSAQQELNKSVSEDTDTDTESRQGIVVENEADTSESYTYDGDNAHVNGTHVVGPGGVTIPPMNQLRSLVPGGTVEVMCLTWNVASKSQSNLARVAGLLSEGHPADRADVICLCFQELPPTNTKYHEDAVKQMSRALAESHSVFCWVRKWSQMMMVFIRKSMIAFASTPEWQFISSSTIVKPVRTKGAIAVYFRFFQASILLITCHLSHGPLINRLNDYSKICESLKFPAIHRFGLPACQSIRYADCVFWFGDLNFRLKSRARLNALGARQTLDNTSVESFFSDLLVDDELTIEKCKGSVFAEFGEAHIAFPPTHKFIAGSNDYVCSRIPSYTDRVLFYAKDENRIRPLMYDSLWDEDCSDHKPVYALFTLRVVDQRH